MMWQALRRRPAAGASPFPFFAKKFELNWDSQRICFFELRSNEA